MNPPSRHLAARESLRRLTTPHALDFGTRLLQRGSGSVITFREFIAVARDCFRDHPERAATYLAALVALDIAAPDEDGGHPGNGRSPN